MYYCAVKQEIHLNKQKKTKRKRKTRRIEIKRIPSLKKEGKLKEINQMRIFNTRKELYRNSATMFILKYWTKMIFQSLLK